MVAISMGRETRVFSGGHRQHKYRLKRMAKKYNSWGHVLGVFFYHFNQLYEEVKETIPQNYRTP